MLVARKVGDRVGNIGACLASERQDWQTPEHVLTLVREVHPIGLDPCTTADNPTGAAVWLAPPEDGLAVHWRDLCPPGCCVFVNPPYGTAVGRWTDHGLCDAFGPPLVYLVPARTDTRWWHRALNRAYAVCYWRGRIRFVGAAASAPFPSAVLYRGPNPLGFCAVFGRRGLCHLL